MEKVNPKRRYLVGVGIALMTIVTTYLVHTNPVLNLADLTSAPDTTAVSVDIFVPTYTASVGDDGLIEIVAKDDIPAFDGMTFELNYSPVDALVFDSNPIVFDGTTQFQSAAFQMTATPEPGKLIVTIVLDDLLDLPDQGDIIPGDGDVTLFKLDTFINASLPAGQVINLSFDNFAVLNGASPVVAVGIPDTTITTVTQNKLKVLSANSIDSTHVALTFSDFITDLGLTGDYTLSPILLPVIMVESGTGYGYDQKTVVLTTNPQISGQEYVVTVDPTSNITSNQEGDLDPNFSNTLFYGFGTGTGVLSDFGLTSATVTGYNTITAVFSDSVEAASVTSGDFNLEIQETAAAVPVTNVSSVTGNQVVLTISTPLLKDNTYILSTNSPASVLRDSDGAQLGITETAFAGVSNGPRLIAASVTEQAGPIYRLQLTFDENITVAGVNSAVGTLYDTGNATTEYIDNFDVGAYNQSVSGATLTLENAVFNDANGNFTFSVNDPSFITNSLGVPVDDTYKSISFWGYDHDNLINSVNDVQVTKKNTFLVSEGTLDLATVTPGDLSVFYTTFAGAIATEAVSSFSENSDGDLEVVMTNTLDPDRHYTMRIVDPLLPAITLVAEDFVVTRDLTINSAEAISPTDLRVYFSENIDENDVDFADFLVEDDSDAPVVITGLTIDPSFQSVVLQTVGALTSGEVFQVTVTGDDDVYAFDGNAVLKNTAFFTGYLTLGAQSPVSVSLVETMTAQTLRLTFSDAVDLTSFTPINLNIAYFDNPVLPSSTVPLVVTNVSQVSSTVYELTTSVQVSGQNYYITFDGVEDSDGLLLGNESPPSFLGFELPDVTISLVTPSALENDLETNVILTGQNLDLVQELQLGNTVMTTSNQSAGSLTFTVPANFTPDLYDIDLIDTVGNSKTFNNALLVSVPVQELTVHSAQSQAIPLNVPNNGTTPTTLWLLVEDPVGLSNITSVVVDLSQIGGPSTMEMQKDSGTQPLNSQWYTYETTIPETIATQDDPYLLPVEVRKGSVTFDGTVSIRVTKDVTASVAPVIDQVYVSPISVPPDGQTPVKISAQITDQDGAGTINSVVADLGALGIGFKTLTPLSDISEGVELETQFYESEEFTVPETTALGNYTINVIASDVTGEQTISTIQIQVSTSATGPVIDGDVSYISPRNSVPNDDKTTFSLHVFVSDTNGVSDIQSVTATFGTIGLPPISLSQDAGLGSSGDSAWYTATDLTIPSTSPIGVHDIEIIATDSNGGLANYILKLDVTHKDTLGDAPRFIDDRSYTAPKVAVNDGVTSVTLYTFVQDDDDDIESVVVNLSDIGQVGSENSGVLGSDDTTSTSGNCPTGSNVIVCMQPSVKEGDNGQWFILPDVTISEQTLASSFPYEIQVIATDSGGKTSTGNIPVYVGSVGDIGSQQEAPRVLAAIPTSDTTIEVLFNKEMSATSILSSGNKFIISSNSDVSQTLPVLSTAINPAGTIVTLDTSNQAPGKAYVLSVSSEVKDISGRGVLQGGANKLSFLGFKYLNKAPIIEYITATNVDTLEVEFRHNLKPTSASISNINIYEGDNSSRKLDILKVMVLAPGNILKIVTSPQVADTRYRVNIDGLSSYDGTTLPVSLNKGFVGYNLQVAQYAAAINFADLNSDGRVDFTDFTIFSSVYGTVYVNGVGTTSGSTSGGSQPIAGQPLSDSGATVPITSVPAGGAIQ